MGPIRKAVIPAAGLGTRFFPATKAVPQELLPIVDAPAIQLVVEEAAKAGLTQAVVITGHGKEAIERHFAGAADLEAVVARRGAADAVARFHAALDAIAVTTVRQPELLGLGHAVLCARELVGAEPFAVLLGDDLYDAEPPAIRQLVDLYEEHGKAVVALVEVPEAEAHRYGIVAGDFLEPGIWRINDMVEKPAPGTAPSRLALAGRYVLPPEVFDILARTGPGAGDQIQLTDALRVLGRERGILGALVRGRRWDTGDPVGWVVANVARALARDDLHGPLEAQLRELLEPARGRGP